MLFCHCPTLSKAVGLVDFEWGKKLEWGNFKHCHGRQVIF